MSNLALLGGEKAVKESFDHLIKWPIVNEEMEQGVLQVLRDGNMSGTDITKKFEKEFAAWQGSKYALAHCSGTQSLQAAMWACGVTAGKEMICPSVTYWASAVQALNLGASVNFADIERDTLCLDPADIEHRINERTAAIMVVHYLSHPADMDPIMEIARKHNVKVIEDVSHAQGGLYKGRKLGTIGDAAGMSLMTGKSFAIGEGGMLTTDDREIYERAIIFGHYARQNELEIPEYVAGAAMPWGGYKNRMSQFSSILGLAQLKKYDAECAEIDKAMKYFWQLLKGVPGLYSHCPKWPDSNKAGWYCCHGLYEPAELGGLSISRFCEAVTAEGVSGCAPGMNKEMHHHPLFNTIDVYGDGKPTAIRNLPEGVDIRNPSLPVTDAIQDYAFFIPWFKHFDKPVIEEVAGAFRKVAENYQELLPGDDKRKAEGAWFLSKRKN